MNPIQAIRLYGLFRKFEAVVKGKGSFMQKFVMIVHLLGTAAAALGVPTLAQSWLNQPGHAMIFVVVVGISLILHAILPSIFSGPSEDAQKATGFGSKTGMILLCFLLGGSLLWPASVRAQALTASTDAIGFLDANKSVGTKLAETLPVHYFNTDKTAFLSVQGTQIINTTLGATSYLGGIEYTPNLRNYLNKHTTLTSDNLSVSVSGGAGNTTFSSDKTNRFTWMLGGKLTYKATSTVTAKLFEAGYLSYGYTRAPYISGGALVTFGR